MTTDEYPGPVPVVSLGFEAADSVRLTPQQWEARAAEVRAEAADDELAAPDVVDALRSMSFDGGDGSTWCYDGDAWWSWTAGAWNPGMPPPQLKMKPFTLDVMMVPEEWAVEEEAAPLPAPGVDVKYRPTHTVPASGMPTWPRPDPGLPSEAFLDAALDVMLLEQRNDGWARVLCSNGWEAWVDGRLLEPLAARRLTE